MEYIYKITLEAVENNRKKPTLADLLWLVVSHSLIFRHSVPQAFAFMYPIRELYSIQNEKGIYISFRLRHEAENAPDKIQRIISYSDQGGMDLLRAHCHRFIIYLLCLEINRKCTLPQALFWIYWLIMKSWFLSIIYHSLQNIACHEQRWTTIGNTQRKLNNEIMSFDKIL